MVPRLTRDSTRKRTVHVQKEEEKRTTSFEHCKECHDARFEWLWNASCCRWTMSKGRWLCLLLFRQLMDADNVNEVQVLLDLLCLLLTLDTRLALP